MKKEVSIVFPGQGSQKLNMGKQVYENFKEAQLVFSEVSEAIKLDISKIIFGESVEELKKTENTQVCLMATSIAIFKVFEAILSKPVASFTNFMAGHSLGEYSAICASGSLSISECAKILRKRGELMAQAMPSGGGMLAIIGLEDAVIEEVIAKSKQGQTLVMANENSIGQSVLSGNIEAIERALIIAKEMKAKIATKLEVSGPFHSPLLQEASNKMKAELELLNFKMPQVSVINNVNVGIYSNIQEIKTTLATQVTSPVKWRQTMLKMQEEGTKTAIEIGSGKVLCGLFKRTCPEIKTFNLELIEEIEEVVKTLN